MAVSVLIVDDSATCRIALRQALQSDPEIRVVGEAADGEEALALLTRLEPDIVTMDVLLGKQSGLDVTESIMSTAPRPILVLTAMNTSDRDLVYRAIRAGALDVWPKLPLAGSPALLRARQELVRVVKDLSRVPVVHRWKRSAPGPVVRARPEEPTAAAGGAPRVLAIGASTGGPPVVSSVLERLPVPPPLSVVIVQHIAQGFARGFADWLGDTTGHDVSVVDEPLEIRCGKVYVAPDGHHVEFTSARLLVRSASPPRLRHRPSIDTLFESMARHLGAASVAVLLTGMGQDGVEGLALLRQSGALTIAQDPQTCAVDSMPRHAIERMAARLVLSPEEIGEALVKRLGAPSGPDTHP
jgi:two-component system chemotaxis response regulator CheB